MPFKMIIVQINLSGMVHVFPNGYITRLSNMTRVWSAYIHDVGDATKPLELLIRQVAAQT